MANITITVQSLVNTAVYDSYTIDNGQTVAQLKAAVNTARGYDSAWYDLSKNETVLSESATLASLSIVSGTVLRTHNKIGRMASKELKQKAKLDLATLDRAASNDPRATADITTLPTQFNGNAIVDNLNIGGLVVGRPWIETVSTFTFYEAFGTTTAISTTQYVSGNKIYAESSTYDVPDYQPARVVVNDIEVVNTELRGHTLVVLDSYGDVVTAATQYDTYINPANLTALSSALGAVPSGNIVVLVVYDASALDASVRSAINTGYGSTNTNTWSAGRTSQLFIGIKS
jgi:hypothetical protein